MWQLGILGLAAVWLLGFRRGVVPALLAAGVLGVVARDGRSACVTATVTEWRTPYSLRPVLGC